MKPSQRLIINKSASYYGVPAKYLTERTREAKYTIPRWTAMYLCQKLRQDSFKRIGMGFDDRDHSTVMHGISALIARMNDNSDLKLQVSEIEGIILHRIEVMKSTRPPPKLKPLVIWDFHGENLQPERATGNIRAYP